jgi:hypothetical protein
LKKYLFVKTFALFVKLKAEIFRIKHKNANILVKNMQKIGIISRNKGTQTIWLKPYLVEVLAEVEAHLEAQVGDQHGQRTLCR